MRFLRRSRSKPHKRFVNACPGTGRMPDTGAHSTEYGELGLCPVCKGVVTARKHRDTKHNWPKGSLVLHSRPRDEAKLTWWERWLNLPEGERR